MVSKILKPSAKNPQGGIVKKEAPIQVSNLNVVDQRLANRHVGRKKVLMVELFVVIQKNQGGD